MAPTGRIELSAGTALVTGATGGIGRAVARALASRGMRLIVSGRRAAELDGVAAEVGGRAVVADLAERRDVELLAAEGLAAEVDILIANAALPASGLLFELTPDEIDRMLEVNLRAPIALARALGPAMAQRGRGHLVFVSSLSGKAASPASSIYSATKFGLRGFALGLREDLRAGGVGVSLVAPGFVREAGMFARSGLRLPPGVGTRSPQQVADAVLEAIQRNRAEVEVAPVPLRLGAAVASIAPEVAAWGSRLMGSHQIASDLAARQRERR